MSQMPILIKTATEFGHLLFQNTAHRGLTTNFSSYTNKNSNCSTTGLFLSYVTFQKMARKREQESEGKKRGEKRASKEREEMWEGEENPSSSIPNAQHPSFGCRKLISSLLEMLETQYFKKYNKIYFLRKQRGKKLWRNLLFIYLFKY